MAVTGRYKKQYHAIRYLYRSTESNTEPARPMWITYSQLDNLLISGVFRLVNTLSIHNINSQYSHIGCGSLLTFPIALPNLHTWRQGIDATPKVIPMDRLEYAKKVAEDALDCARDAQLTALYAIKHSNNRDTINALMSDMRKQQLLADDALLAYQQIKQQEEK